MKSILLKFLVSIVVLNLIVYPFGGVLKVSATGLSDAKVNDNVTVSITDSKTDIASGDNVNYDLKIENIGNSDIDQLSVKVNFSQYFQFINTNIPGFSLNGSIGTFSISNFSVKGSNSYTISYTISGKISLTSDIQSLSIQTHVEVGCHNQLFTADDLTNVVNKSYVAPVRPNFSLFLNCVSANGNTFEASFGYKNLGASDLQLSKSQVTPSGNAPTTLKVGSFDNQFKVTANVNQTITWTAEASGVTSSVQATSSSTPCNSTAVAPQTLGSITVCKAVINKDRQIVDGSILPGATFKIRGFKPTNKVSSGDPTSVILPESTFTTPLKFNTAIFNDQGKNDAQCVTYSNLPIGHYFYTQEDIQGTSWTSPLYNDQFSLQVKTLNDFLEYQPQLFDNDLNNDGQRNLNADGDIQLSNERPNRTLVILNQYDHKLDEQTQTQPVDNSKFGGYFDDKDKPFCSIEPTWQTVTGTVFLPSSVSSARLQLSWYVVHPKDSTVILPDGKSMNEIRYYDYGIVTNGYRFSIQVYWPGVKPEGQNDVIENHIGANLLDPKTGNQLPGVNVGGLDYWWDSSTCPAPKPGQKTPPIANPDLSETQVGQPVIIDILKNDTATDGALVPSTVEITSQPGNGTIEVNKETGEVTYTPNDTFTGTDTFKYKVCDTNNLCSETTVTVLVNPNTPQPEVKGSITICVLVVNQDNEFKDGSDLAGSMFKISGVDLSKNQTVPLSVLPETTYTTPLAFNQVLIGNNTPNSQCIKYSNLDMGHYGYTPETISGSGWETPLYDDQYNQKVQSLYDFYPYDNKTEGRNLNSDGDILLTPQTPDRTLVILNKYNDQKPQQELYPPIAKDDEYTTKQNQSVDGEILINDSDQDGNLVPSTVKVTIEPEHGIVEIDKTTGEMKYIPDHDFTGVDTFVYEVCDNDGLCDKANVTITVIPDVPPTKEVKGDITICFVIQNNEGQLVTGANKIGSSFTMTSGSKGKAIPDTTVHTELNLNKSLYNNLNKDDSQCQTYPNLELGDYYYNKEQIGGDNWLEPLYSDEYNSKNKDVSQLYSYDESLFDNNTNNDALRNIASDGLIQLTEERPSRTLVILNRYKPDEVKLPPVAVDDNVVTPYDTPIRINELSNDKKGSSELDSSTVEVINGPQNGTAVVEPNTGIIIYTPNPGFIGQDTIKYKVCDLNNLCTEAIITINVQSPSVNPEPPTIITEPTPILDRSDIKSDSIVPIVESAIFDVSNLKIYPECSLSRLVMEGGRLNSNTPINKIEISIDNGNSWSNVSEVNGLGTSSLDFRYETGKITNGLYSVIFKAISATGKEFKSDSVSAAMNCTCGIVILGDYYQNGFGQGVLSSSGDLIYNSDLSLTLFAETLGGVEGLKLQLSSDKNFPDNDTKEYVMNYDFTTKIWSTEINKEDLNREKTYARLVYEGCTTVKKPIPTIINTRYQETTDTYNQVVQGYNYQIFFKDYDKWSLLDYKNEISKFSNAQLNLQPGEYYIEVSQPDGRELYTKKFVLSNPSVVTVHTPTIYTLLSPATLIASFFQNLDVSIYSKANTDLKLEDTNNDPNIKDKYLSIAKSQTALKDISKYIFIYWNRWDPIFSEQLNQMEKLSDQLKNEGVIVLADPNNIDEIKSINRNTKLNLKVVEVDDGEFLNKELRYLPEYVLLDTNNARLDRVRGNLTLDEIKTQLSNYNFLETN